MTERAIVMLLAVSPLSTLNTLLKNINFEEAEG